MYEYLDIITLDINDWLNETIESLFNKTNTEIIDKECLHCYNNDKDNCMIKNTIEEFPLYMTFQLRRFK
jgi:hypothetical protein